MGEIAEMILEGELCQECGEFMDGATGHPRTCRACRSAGPDPHERIPCDICGKRVKRIGMTHHKRDAHKENAA